jgi:hypothetical protein
MWTKICKLEPKGHKLFREDNGFRAPELCRYAIADDSGNTPDETCDGPLFLDFSKPLRLSGNANTALAVNLPVLDHRGESSWVATGVTGGCALLQRFPAWAVTHNKQSKQLEKLFSLL